MSPSIDVPAEPSAFTLTAGKTALIVIDMQRDFLLPAGFGESLATTSTNSSRWYLRWRR